MNRSIIFVAIFSAVMSLTLSYWTYEGVQQSGLDKFDSQAAEYGRRFEYEANKSVVAVTAVSSFMAVNSGVDRDGFDRFTDPLLQNSLTIQALEWVPVVQHGQRENYVQKARAHKGLATFEFTERIKGALETAGQRPEYFPVYFVNPLQPNHAALGFDLGSSPARLKALRAAAKSGLPAATGRIRLVQETKSQFGFLIFRPVYANNNSKSLSGFGLGVFRIGDMLKAVIEGDSFYKNEVRTSVLEHDLSRAIYLFDRSDQTEILAFSSDIKGAVYTADMSYDDLNAQVHFERQFTVAGRKWSMVVMPDFAGLQRPAMVYAVIAFVVSAIFFIVIILLFNGSLRREDVIQAEVNLRTAELDEARKTAEIASHAKSDFLTTMSHELRTPLTSILGAGELLKNETMPEAVSDQIDNIMTSAHLQLDVVNGILDLSQIEAGRLTFEQVEFNLQDIIKKISVVLSGQADAKGIDLKMSVIGLGEEYMVIGDPLRLQQIIFNLVSNAVKFTETGHVEMIARLSEEVNNKQSDLIITIKDTGIGIAADKIPTLFEKFTQGDQSISRKYGGSGIGLSICKKLIDALRGKIRVQSALGQGAVFYVTVPVAIGKKIAEEKVKKIDTAQLPEGLRVLVAEDVELNQKIIQKFLTLNKAEVTVVADGHLAVEAWKQTAFDVILMDIRMPVMGGVTAAETIRGLNDAGKKVPIISLSADIFDTHDTFDKSLTKPIDWEKLKQTICDLL